MKQITRLVAQCGSTSHAPCFHKCCNEVGRHLRSIYLLILMVDLLYDL
jgi:hypothetical protein